MYPISFPWKPRNQPHLVQNSRPQPRPISDARLAQHVESEFACTPMVDAFGLAQPQQCANPSTKGWLCLRIPVRGLTCTSRTRQSSSMSLNIATGTAVFQPPRPLPRLTKKVPPSKVISYGRLLRKRAQISNRREHMDRLKLLSCPPPFQIDTRANASDIGQPFDPIDFYSSPVTALAISDIPRSVSPGHTLTYMAATGEVILQDNTRGTDTGRIQAERPRSVLPSDTPKLSLTEEQSSSTAVPKPFTQSPSEGKALDRFCSGLDQYANQTRAHGRPPIFAPSSTPGTSLHTVAVLLPFRKQFRASGLAVTSHDQRRDVRTKGMAWKRARFPKLPEEAALTISEPTHVEPTQTDGAWSDREGSSSDYPTSGPITEIDFTLNDPARVLTCELSRIKPKPEKKHHCLLCGQCPSVDSEAFYQAALHPGAAQCPSVDSEAVHQAALHPAAALSNSSFTSNRNEDQMFRRKDYTLKTDEVISMPGRSAPRRPWIRVPRLHTNSSARHDAKQVSARNGVFLVADVFRRAPDLAAQGRNFTDKKTSGRRRRDLSIPEVLQSTAIPEPSINPHSVLELAREKQRGSVHSRSEDTVQVAQLPATRPASHSLSEDCNHVAQSAAFWQHSLHIEAARLPPPRQPTKLGGEAAMWQQTLSKEPPSSLHPGRLLDGDSGPRVCSMRPSQGRPLILGSNKRGWEVHDFQSPVITLPESSAPSSALLPFTLELALSNASSLERAICAVASPDTTKLGDGSDLKGQIEVSPRVSKRQSSKRAVTAAGIRTSSGRLNQAFSSGMATNESAYAEIDDGNISDSDVLRGLGIAVSAACSREMDTFIRKKTGLRLRRFLADLRAFESLGSEDQRWLAQVESEQHVRRGSLELVKLKQGRRMAWRLREWRGQ